ncbi:MAG: NADH:ubiquinone oxidoreductase [Elusimicrobiota bacterium]
MRYLGIELKKPRIAVFDFTCCEGCELQLANKEETLVDFLSLVEVVNFREVSSDKSEDYEIAFVEGAVSREDEVARLKKIRVNAKVLVAFGACACFGGVNQIKNKFPLKSVVREVYGRHRVATSKVRKISEVVKVDLEIPGCPVSKKEVERIVVALVTGAGISLPKYPVCLECKAKCNVCVLDLGQICLGPITRAGCDSPCPSGGTACLGCRGPAPEANYESFLRILKDRGFKAPEIKERLEFYGAFNGVMR